MVFFNNKVVTFDELAEGLSAFTLNTIAEHKLDSFKKLLKEMGENTEIDWRMKREMLILNMLAVTLTVNRFFPDKADSTKLLDTFHYRIYVTILDSEAEIEEFNKIVNLRYLLYKKILASDESMMMLELGKQIAKSILNKEVSSMPFIMCNAELFSIQCDSVKKLLEEISSQFKIKK